MRHRLNVLVPFTQENVNSTENLYFSLNIEKDNLSLNLMYFSKEMHCHARKHYNVKALNPFFFFLTVGEEWRR